MTTHRIGSNPINNSNSRPLSDILHALVNDFTRASVSRDLSEVFWRDVYKNHATLSEFTPSRVRVVSAKISLPVAAEDISEKTVKDVGVLPEQIASLLSPRFTQQERTQLAIQMHSKLVEEDKHGYTNKTLIEDLARVASMLVPNIDVKKDIDLARLTKIQRDYVMRPHEEEETRYLYRVADLEKINPDHIIRLELTLSID